MRSLWSKPSHVSRSLPLCASPIHPNPFLTRSNCIDHRSQLPILSIRGPRALSASAAAINTDSLERANPDRLSQLERYIDEHGDADVPYDHPSGLGRWIAAQRHRWRRGRLPTSLFRALTAAGVPMDGDEARWAARFAQLAEFHSRHGHCCVPHTGPTSTPGLYPWILVQRQRWRQRRLEDSRARRLDGLGFPWDVTSARNAERMVELELFFEQHGHAKVPRRWRGNPKLARWLETLPERAHTLTAAQQARLGELGWECGESRRGRGLPWAARLEQLRQLRARKGNLSGQLPNTGAFAGLRMWAQGVRKRRRQGTLPAAREAELVALGFEFEPREAAFMRRLEAVDAEIERRGLPGAYAHLVLLGGGGSGSGRRRGRRPSTAVENEVARPRETELGRWVARVRRTAQAGGLSGEASAALVARGLLPGAAVERRRAEGRD